MIRFFSLSLSLSLSSFSLFDWCYSADARDISLSQAGVWFDDEILQKRASFRGRISEPSVLSIRNINLGDQAVYRCRVDFREAKSRNGRLNLTVIGESISSLKKLETVSEKAVQDNLTNVR